MIKKHHLQSFFIRRWVVSLIYLSRGAYIHPGARMLGPLSAFDFGKSTKISKETKLYCDGSGRIETGVGVWLATGVEMETTSSILVGDGTSIQRRCTINGTVTIGGGCIFAPNVFISSGTHPFREYPKLSIREQEEKIRRESGSLAHLDRPVTIGNDCWLGVNVVVCPGVTIGTGAIVGANAVVTKDVPPYSVVGGVPARVIGLRE